MPAITELKDTINTKTLNLVLLSFATGGIYPILWMYRNAPTLETITKKPIFDDVFIICIAFCVGLGGTFASIGEEIFDIIGSLLTFAAAGLYTVWAFKAKNVLQLYALNEYKIDLKMNVFYTFLFNVYYINYCINDLSEVKRKQEILSGVKSDLENK